MVSNQNQKGFIFLYKKNQKSFFFWFLKNYNIQSKLDIREEYKQELIEKEQYNNEQDAEFLKKFKHWISKNPNDSKSLNNSIQKEWERK